MSTEKGVRNPETTFDFADYDDHLPRQEAGAWQDIILPNGKSTPLRIRVSGPDSKRVREAIRWGRDKMAEEGLTEEGRVRIGYEVSARCCSEWEGAHWRGEDRSFSVAELTAWIERMPFIAPQIDAVTNSRARFIPA